MFKMGLYSGFLFVCLVHLANAKDCAKEDIKPYSLACDPNSSKRKVVTYLNSDCNLKDPSLIEKPKFVPCDCPAGKGLSGDPLDCHNCSSGSYSSGGEDISDWGSWTVNGTVPPQTLGISTYCETYRSYVRPCEHWKASFFNDTLESGDNSKTRCMSSVLTIRKQFVKPDSFIKFTFRIEGRKCYSSYVGCDGLAFYVDNKQIMSFTGNQFVWKSATYNVTTGFHQLKWIYRKNCYSFPYEGIADKAFIRSIILDGTLEPQTKCVPCPAGSYSDKSGAKECKKCPYFQYQPEAGKSSCKSCGQDSYSMLGAAYCIPLLNCTNDDLIMAPEKLESCIFKNDNFYRKLTPTYANVMIEGNSHNLCIPMSTQPKSKVVPCRCQPGYQLTKDSSSGSPKPKCQRCPNGQHSVDGIKCKNCPSGYVTLMGDHFYTWVKDTLPKGFSAYCSGNCAVKTGWISSGDHVRTSRVVGDVISYIQTSRYKIISNIARINFTCAVACNVSQPNRKLAGNHLAEISDCNLIFQVWTNNTLAEQLNCTSPKGRYTYRHEKYRDGRLVVHSYPLKKGSYLFRWVFIQGDELKSTSAAFEAKLYNISIIGIDGGSAMNCTPCLAGSYSVSGNTDCSKCPKGTFSKPGSSRCTPCPNGTYADTEGSGRCLRCGANTLSLPTRDGCTNNNCMFSPSEGVDYDFSELSRENGPMFEVLTYQVQSRGPARRPFQQRPISGGSTHLRRLTFSRRYSIWPPYRQRFYLNLCTVKHENTSCTSFNLKSGVQESLPVMGCRTSYWSRRDTSIGRVIGFRPKADVRSGVMVDLLNGDGCYSRKPGIDKYRTTIDLQCDVEAGVGNPGPENNYTQVLRSDCNYYFVWKSLYACPKCRKQDLEKVTHECVNGIANVTISKRIPCWGSVDGVEAGITNVSCTIYMKSRLLTVQSTVNKVLIGVGVVIIVTLIIVAGYFFYKHRDIRYKYYNTLARDKPMSKLEEEEEDFGQVEGDMFHDSRNIVRG